MAIVTKNGIRQADPYKAFQEQNPSMDLCSLQLVITGKLAFVTVPWLIGFATGDSKMAFKADASYFIVEEEVEPRFHF